MLCLFSFSFHYHSGESFCSYCNSVMCVFCTSQKTLLLHCKGKTSWQTKAVSPSCWCLEVRQTIPLQTYLSHIIHHRIYPILYVYLLSISPPKQSPDLPQILPLRSFHCWLHRNVLWPQFGSLSGSPARAATGWGLRRGLDEVNREGVGVSVWWQCPLFIVRLEVDLLPLFPPPKLRRLHKCLLPFFNRWMSQRLRN